jgi:hypothetical protein
VRTPTPAGEKARVTLHPFPGPSVAGFPGQLFEVMENSLALVPEITKPANVTAAVPVFAILKLMPALVLPVVVVPKVSDCGLNDSVLLVA